MIACLLCACDGGSDRSLAQSAQAEFENPLTCAIGVLSGLPSPLNTNLGLADPCSALASFRACGAQVRTVASGQTIDRQVRVRRDTSGRFVGFDGPVLIDGWGRRRSVLSNLLHLEPFFASSRVQFADELTLQRDVDGRVVAVNEAPVEFDAVGDLLRHGEHVFTYRGGSPQSWTLEGEVKPVPVMVPAGDEVDVAYATEPEQGWSLAFSHNDHAPRTVATGHLSGSRMANGGGWESRSRVRVVLEYLPDGRPSVIRATSAWSEGTGSGPARDCVQILRFAYTPDSVDRVYDERCEVIDDVDWGTCEQPDVPDPLPCGFSVETRRIREFWSTDCRAMPAGVEPPNDAEWDTHATAVAPSTF